MADRDHATRDSAFLWETEALRSASPRPTPPPAQRGEEPAGSDWLTLREANEATGIPISTLRKWARREAIPTYMRETATGQLRMVSIRAVRERAASLGREDGPGADVASSVAPSAPPATTPAAFAPPPQAETQPEPPPGTMIVPIDAWDKMLLQLGNLHEAGQQLAEARERAAKAETEARFLKERLAELRSDLAQAGSPQTQARRPFVEESPPEPISHIPIESPDDEVEPEDEFEIPVRDIDKERAEQPESTAPILNDDEMTLAEYSLEMMKHIYSTWRRRPRR